MTPTHVEQSSPKTQNRLPTLAAIGILLLGIYSIISRFPLRTPRTVNIPDAVPLIPLLALPYLGVLVVGWFMPLALRDAQRYRTCLRAMVLAFVFAAGLWVLVPTVMSRPPIPATWWNAPYRWLLVWDAPTNVFPCGHILAPLISGWYLWQERPDLRWWVWALNIVSVVCIACTWQHRPMDIAVGAMLAGLSIIGISLVERYRAHECLTESGDDTARG